MGAIGNTIEHIIIANIHIHLTPQREVFSRLMLREHFVQVVHRAQLNTLCTQDAVRRRHVEVEVRDGVF